jgi:[acyl-carrier-protein] S-malonyltransferase
MVRVAFLFPGQGAQYVGMARDLCASLPAARALFDEAAGVLGYDLLDCCANGPAEKLNSTVVSQPAIYVASLAALRSLEASEPAVAGEWVATAGLSLGEYTALTSAGVIDFRTGLSLVQKRGAAMQTASDTRAGTMVSVLTLDQPKVEDVVAKASARGLVRLANLLCPGNLVLSGEVGACEEAARLAEAAGGRAVRLSVAGAFHTPLMESAVAPLKDALAAAVLAEPRVPVWANVTGRPYQDAAEVRDLLARQVTEPVLWEPTIRGLLESGVERFYEIGPGRVLAGLLKRVQRKADCRNVGA